MHFTSPHSTTWWGDQKLVRTDVRLTAWCRTILCIPPVHTVPHGGEDQKLVRMDVRLTAWCRTILCIPPVHTVPHGGEIKNLRGWRCGLQLSTEPFTASTMIREQAEVSVHSTSPHSTTRWGDQKLVRREVRLTAQHRTLYRFNHDTGSG